WASRLSLACGGGVSRWIDICSLGSPEERTKMRIRRLWFPVVLVVVGLVVGILGFAMWRLDAFIASHKDWITRQLEAKLARRVRFGAVHVSLRGGLSVQVDNVLVADDPR